MDGGTDRYENWLSNSLIRGYISNFKTIHVFMVSDACFSGDILNVTRSLPPQIDNAYYRKAYALTTRQVLTSGSSETVPDESEFSEAIKMCLRKNTAPLLDPIGIYNDVRLSVRSTTPLYGTLTSANHQDGATFLFFRKQANVPIQPAVGSISVTSDIAGEIFIDGQPKGIRVKEGGVVTVRDIDIGVTEVAVREDNGTIIKAPQTVMVRQGQTAAITIERPVPEGLAFQVVDGKSVTITRYRGNAATVHIPERIQGLPVTVIGTDAFVNCSSLTGVTIPSSVTTIGINAFYKCSSLTNIAIPSSVTTIGFAAFYGCSSLTGVTITSSVTTIGAYAFNGCSSLTGITVDSRNSAYTSIDGVLFDKNVKTIIAYPAGKKGNYTIPSSVITIGDGAFASCSSLTGVTISSSVRAIGDNAFNGCSSLIGVTIPSSVTTIGYATFSFCSSLTSVTIPSSVTTIKSYAFYNCSSLTSVTLSRRTQVGVDAFPASTRISYSD